jgi:hypothetical protein
VTSTPAGPRASRSGRDRFDRITLRFDDPELEATFRGQLFGNVITSVRVGYLLGIAT